MAQKQKQSRWGAAFVAAKSGYNSAKSVYKAQGGYEGLKSKYKEGRSIANEVGQMTCMGNMRDRWEQQAVNHAINYASASVPGRGAINFAINSGITANDLGAAHHVLHHFTNQ